MSERYVTRMLVVEDSPGDVFFVQRMLYYSAPDQHFDIVSVPRLADAFRRAEKEKFDVVLLDLNLLDIDGIASVAALHAQIPNTPIIVYSGMESKKLKEAALMCGASEYLVKGCNGGSLTQAITHHTSHHAA